MEEKDLTLVVSRCTFHRLDAQRRRRVFLLLFISEIAPLNSVRICLSLALVPLVSLDRPIAMLNETITSAESRPRIPSPPTKTPRVAFESV